MWVRLLDVPAALAARRYATDLDVVLDVHDPFLDLGGRVRLEGGADGAACQPTADRADLALGVGALGSLYLGGVRAQTLARAGLIDEHIPGSVARLDLAFLAEREPHYGTNF